MTYQMSPYGYLKLASNADDFLPRFDRDTDFLFVEKINGTEFSDIPKCTDLSA